MDASKFVLVTACIFGSWSALLIIIRVIGYLLYRNDHLQQAADAVSGIVRTFPIIKPLCVASICWAVVIARCL